MARWETTRVIEDPQEHERAVKARGKARSLISGGCINTGGFGLICPLDNRADLEARIKDARRVCEEHNASATHTKIAIYVMRGEIASTDEEAIRSMASEITDLLAEMERGVRAVDAKAVRDAANKAALLGQTLEAEQAEKVAVAVEAARKAARQIVKRIEKNGEEAAKVAKELSTAAISMARFAFLDLTNAPVAEGEALPGVNLQRMAELDVEPAPESEPEPESSPCASRAIDVEPSEIKAASGASQGRTFAL